MRNEKHCGGFKKSTVKLNLIGSFLKEMIFSNEYFAEKKVKHSG
jgi:hypothetical protein